MTPLTMIFTSYCNCHLLLERYFVYQTNLYSENQTVESILPVIFHHESMTFLFQCSSEADITKYRKKLHRNPQNKIGAKLLVVVVDLFTSSVSVLFLFKNQLVYGVLQLLMEVVVSSFFEFCIRSL